MVSPEKSNKALIRKETLKIRDSIDPETKKIKDREIEKRLLDQKEFEIAKNIMFFASFRSEPDTFRIMEKSIHMGKRIILPKVNREKHELLLYEILDVRELTPGFMNIPEPEVSEGRRFSAEDLDLMIVPGVAFGWKGERIGYGGGYYDRLIHRIKRRPPLIAIAYEEQILEEVPLLDHDIKMDKIITDKRVLSRD